MENTATWPAHPEAEAHRQDAIDRMNAALDRAESPPPLRHELEPDPRDDPNFEEGDIDIGMAGTLLEMMLEQGEPSEDMSWACHNVWKAGSLTLILGAQQSFKSWSMLDLAYHALDGTKWLEREVERFDYVFYASNEKGSQAVYERLWKVFRERKDLAGRMFVKHRQSGLSFGNDAWHSFVREVKEQRGRVLVILDTLTSLAPSGYDENSLKDVSKMLTAIREMQDGTHVDVMLVHHLNAVGERPRGHTALDGEVDGFVKFDRRGRDIDEVLVTFEPKDGLPSVGSYRFASETGLFQRTQARALHVKNLRAIVSWYQERNGEGITLRDLRDQFFSGYRYHKVEEYIVKAEDELVLKRETRTSMTTNREAELITVMTDEERGRITKRMHVVEDAEFEAEAKAEAIVREAKKITEKGTLGLGS